MYKNIQNISVGDYVENTETNKIGIAIEAYIDGDNAILVRCLGLQKERWHIFCCIKPRYSNDEIEAMLNSAIKMHERLRQINELSTQH